MRKEMSFAADAALVRGPRCCAYHERRFRKALREAVKEFKGWTEPTGVKDEVIIRFPSPFHKEKFERAIGALLAERLGLDAEEEHPRA